MRLLLGIFLSLNVIFAIDLPSECQEKYTPGCCCQAWIPIIYYDVEKKICRRAIYGGCGGSGHQFINMKECNEICVFPFRMKNLSLNVTMPVTTTTSPPIVN